MTTLKYTFTEDCQNLEDNGPYFERFHEGDAGYDLKSLNCHLFKPGEIKSVRTGLRVEIPQGYFGLIKDRSSVALMGISVMAGVVDQLYRGEIVCVMHNRTDSPVHLERGRVAQMVLIPCLSSTPEHLKELSDSSRGMGGFGSTGK